MAKQRTKRKGKVPMIKNFDDIQKMSNANVDATVQSFEGVTKATQAIATEIADYTKRSFEDGTKTMENLLSASRWIKRSRCRPNMQSRPTRATSLRSPS